MPTYCVSQLGESLFYLEEFARTVYQRQILYAAREWNLEIKSSHRTIDRHDSHVTKPAYPSWCGTALPEALRQQVLQVAGHDWL